MATAAEFIEYLQSIPPDTEISVIKVYDCVYSTCAKEVPLDLNPMSGNFDFTDFTGNVHVKETNKLYNKKFLVLGEK